MRIRAGAFHQVRYEYPYQEKRDPKWGLAFLFVRGSGLEPIAVELSGGQFLPPVQTLVATSIFSQREKIQIESGHRFVDSALPQ